MTEYLYCDIILKQSLTQSALTEYYPVSLQVLKTLLNDTSAVPRPADI